MPQSQVRLILDVVPPGEGRVKIKALLKRNARKQDEQRLERLLNNCPSVLSTHIGEDKGRLFVEALEKLGAEAHLEPLSTDPGSAATRAAPVRRKARKVFGRAPAATIAASPKPNKLRLFLLLTLLLLVGFYGLLISPLGPWSLLENNSGPAALASRHREDSREMPATLIGSPLRDQRLATALAEAIRLRLGLDGRNVAGPLQIQAASGDGEGEDYPISLEIGDESRQLRLSSGPGKTDHNLRVIALALDEIKPAGEFTGGSLPPADDRPVPDDSRELFTGLMELETGLGGSKDRVTMLRAAELFAWQGFFKTAFYSSNAGDRLSTQALAHYLAAGRPDSYIRALVLLALDLPGPALRALESSPDSKRRQLLRAFIRRDVKSLQARQRACGADAKLCAYLLVRALMDSGQNSQAAGLLKQQMEVHPDFLPLEELAALAVSPGVSNRAANNLPLDLLERHLDLLGTLFGREFLLATPSLVTEAGRAVSEKDALEKWVPLHAQLLNQKAHRQVEKPLFDVAVVKDLLSTEMQDAVFLKFRLEIGGFGRLAEANQLARIIKQSWPNSPMIRLLKLYLNHFENSVDHATRVRRRLNLSGADKSLLTFYIEQASYPTQANEYPRMLNSLERLRILSTPSRSDLLHMVEACRDMKWRNCAGRYLRDAMAVAPFEYKAVALFKDTDLPPATLNAYLDNVRHLPRVAYLEAKHHFKNGDLQTAEKGYRHLVEANPGDPDVYNKLADILLQRGERQQAMDILQGYLQQDDPSLRKVRIMIRLAELERQSGDLQRSYELYEQAAQFGSGDGLDGYARLSELTGRTLQAEHYFRRAAKRYPAGGAPANLALFYLRQGNRATALKTLRGYLRYNGPDYFVKPLVKYAVEIDQPDLAVEIAREVSEENWRSVRVRYFLAKEMEKHEQHAIAAELFGSLAKDVDDPRRTAPYVYAPYYVKAMENARPGSTQSTMQSLIDLYDSIHPTVMEYFGIHLMMYRMPELAVPVFLERAEMSERRLDISVLMAALAWRKAGKNNQAQKVRILELLDDLDDPWLDTRVRFLLQESDEQVLMEHARGRSRLCEAHYFLGAIAAARGDDDRAEQHLITSLQTRAVTYMEYQYAYDLLGELVTGKPSY